MTKEFDNLKGVWYNNERTDPQGRLRVSAAPEGKDAERYGILMRKSAEG